MLTKNEFKVKLESLKLNGNDLRITNKLNQLIDELIKLSATNDTHLNKFNHDNFSNLIEEVQDEFVNLFSKSKDCPAHVKQLSDQNKLQHSVIGQIQGVYACLNAPDVRKFIKDALIQIAKDSRTKVKLGIGFDTIYNKMLDALKVNLSLYNRLMNLNKFRENIPGIYGTLKTTFNQPLSADYLDNNIERILNEINQLPEYSASYWDMTYPTAPKTDMYIRLFSNLLVDDNIANINPATKQVINQLALFKNSSVDNENISKFLDECSVLKATLLQSIKLDYIEKANNSGIFGLNLIKTDNDKINIMQNLYDFINELQVSKDLSNMSRLTVSPFAFLQKVVNAIAITADLICATSIQKGIATGRSLMLLNELFKKTMKLMDNYDFTADPKLIQQAGEFINMSSDKVFSSDAPPLLFSEESGANQSTSTYEAA
ncbi:hypothetical protein L3V82_03305 [Thiotrichales bacterium 19S3-7]|nr:hypothetical protein [Thiotrichales bacterium 19S3-7]MCF6801198.1 hypothetical protein [Thiotrichales bacterium 19S3-11]